MFVIQITTIDGKPVVLDSKDRDTALLQAHEAMKSGVRLSFEDGGFWHIPAHGIAHVRVAPKEQAANDDKPVPARKNVAKKSAPKRAVKKA
jgi:hypothetical protein